MKHEWPIFKMDKDFPGGSVAKDSELLMWGAWVQSLFRELDPTGRN